MARKNNDVNEMMKIIGYTIPYYDDVLEAIIDEYSPVATSFLLNLAYNYGYIRGKQDERARKHKNVNNC